MIQICKGILILEQNISCSTSWTLNCAHNLQSYWRDVPPPPCPSAAHVQCCHIQGLRLRLWTAATKWPIVHPQMIWVWRATVEWCWEGQPKNSEKTCPCARIDLTRARTRASASRGQALTAWAMARPINDYVARRGEGVRTGNTVVPSPHCIVDPLKSGCMYVNTTLTHNQCRWPPWLWSFHWPSSYDNCTVLWNGVTVA
jgi:hypothetical protein